MVSLWEAGRDQVCETPRPRGSWQEGARAVGHRVLGREGRGRAEARPSTQIKAIKPELGPAKQNQFWQSM